MTKDEFYKDLSTAITVGCQLPFDIPQKSLEITVKYAKKWFYRNWVDALENVFILIPKEIWQRDTMFLNNRGFKLPDCIYSVNAVAKDNDSKRKIHGYPDMSIDKFIFSNWGINGGFYSPESSMTSDAVVGYVIASSWGDLTYHIFNYPISYEYNRNTHRLFLKGSLNESPDFILDCDLKIPDEALFEEDLFFNYCLAESKRNLANILGSFEMQLPGNATINYDRYFDQGTEVLNEIKEEIKSMRGGSDFFITTNGN
jgi:hypothetical protein